ncbi:MAG: nitronate monooxygenase, partial [Deltaproteobacteria bacterium]|nr:nitronate monooxygenase [Deltaproteobacteria bacterium]
MSIVDDFRFFLKDREFVPIIVGGMGVDISNSKLALAIANLGGIGHISDAMSPCVSDRAFRTTFQSSKRKRFAMYAESTDKGEVKWDPRHVYEATVNHVRATMEHKSGPGAVFVNIMEKLTMGNPLDTLRARLRAAMDAGIEGITLSAGLHTGSLKLMEDHPRFRDVFVGIIASSARALKIFLRSAKRAQRLPDYIVVEGPLAGGHLGFDLNWKKYNLKSIVEEIISFLKLEKLDIPVVPAGGIFTGTDAAEYLESGAGAVQVATRFTIAQECGLPDRVKQEYLRASEDDVVVNMVSPTGYAMRMLRYSPSLQSNVKPNCEA